MDQEILFKASLIQKQAEEIQQNLQIIDNEINELEEYSHNLEYLSQVKEKSIVTNLGKGLHMKATLEDPSELYVEVGAGVVVKKNILEAKEIIEIQMKKLAEARVHLMGKLEIYGNALENIMQEAQKEQESKSKDSSKVEEKEE